MDGQPKNIVNIYIVRGAPINILFLFCLFIKLLAGITRQKKYIKGVPHRRVLAS